MTVKAGTVCGNCDWLNPLAREVCEDCDHELALHTIARSPETPSGETAQQPVAGSVVDKDSPPLAAQTGAEEEPMDQARHYICKSCYSPVPSGHKFCGKCGTPIPAELAGPDEPGYFGDMQAPGKAKLILIKGEGMDGISYHLNSTEHVAGRVEGPILFTEDKWLSPKHANFAYEENSLVVRDEGSVNGVFLGVRGESAVAPGTMFMTGEQLFRIEEVAPFSDDPEEDGTYYFASPRTETSFRVVQILEGGGNGMVVNAKNNEVIVGREGCDMNFPNDSYISGQHAKVELAGGTLKLVDLESKNGTYLKIEGSQVLSHGDYVFLGRQLLRVEITP